MADRVVPADVRAAIVQWSKDAPRGAVSRFCLEFGVSRSQFYEIRARAQSEGPIAAMQPRPRAGRDARRISIEIEDLAVQIRQELTESGWDAGPVTVRHRLLDLGIAAPAASTLARLFNRRGLVVPAPKKRPRTSWRRFEAASVHECWQMDGFEWHLADGTRFCILQVTDDKSRFPIMTLAVLGERSLEAQAAIALGIERFQVPCRVLTDNGAAFNSDRIGRRTLLVDWLESLGCKPITGKPGHPQTQGKNERAHQGLQRWLRAQPAPENLIQAQVLLKAYDAAFAQRRHQGLAMRTPAQVLIAGPTAIPPTRPGPSPAPTQAPSMRRVKVAPNGNIRHRKVMIHLDREHVGTRVSVIALGKVVTIFDAKGTQIRTIHLTPGTTYYGTGRARGPRSKPTPRQST